MALWVDVKTKVVYASQRPHVDDWVLISSINKLFRELGRQAFFQGNHSLWTLSPPRDLSWQGTFSQRQHPSLNSARKYKGRDLHLRKRPRH
ncbi:hypothetical protein F5B22DRAFT_590847 [Xylaria bambusicola]|uniref:uncharacterized protein n=1 Tax=Xylaria bambusicola TaxID=326684 RepID=UPI0020073BEF|nr:uncharacterized protein F5B22DRAFT_590847 [Xylaria bambusicola]KAI0525637.1 hypothetical protein F5B22DRAFT_590847 [Xylaria bambusicola]